jgi:hypothetical protein
MPRPYLYLLLTLHRHMATTSDLMRWRGSSAEHVCSRRSAVRWACPWGHTAPFRRTPATTPSPSEPGPSLYLRPLGRHSSGARGAAAVQASALGASVNELIDTIFGCYSSSKAADVVPKWAPTIWHKSTACPLCSYIPSPRSRSSPSMFRLVVALTTSSCATSCQPIYGIFGA